MWKQILIDFSSSFLNLPLEISHKVKITFPKYLWLQSWVCSEALRLEKVPYTNSFISHKAHITFPALHENFIL